MDIEKENIDLKEGIKLLQKENNELKNVNNGTNTEDSKVKNSKLEETIKLLKENNFKAVSVLEAENKSLKLHIQNILTCEECEQRFDSKTEMTNHLKSKHQEKECKCDECDEYFKDISNMKIHIQKNHVKILFKCTECEQSFRSSNNLKTHVSYKHKRKGYMQEILKKENHMKAQVMEQKINLH